MMKTIAEGYLITCLLLLHIPVLTCEYSCLPPLATAAAVVPNSWREAALELTSFMHVSIGTLQLLAHVLVLADIVIAALLIIKAFGGFIRKFLFVFMSLAASALIIKHWTIM